MSVDEHRKHARTRLRLGVITVSDSRTAATDESGCLVREMLEAAGHQAAHYEVIGDDPARIRAAIAENLPKLDGIILSGGTGVAPRDTTIEAVRPLFDKELEGFGELFRMLSYNEIGSAAMMSRAVAGISAGKIIAALPGSPAACRLALEKLLLPELGHIAHLLNL
ncbi:MAG: molybdenum cofactor biosynthesis protein B [Candidatus Binataceae bacterium]